MSEMQEVWKFERDVWDKDTIRVVVRARSGKRILKSTFVNAAQERITVGYYLKNHVHPFIDGNEAVVIDGNGDILYEDSETILEDVRGTY